MGRQNLETLTDRDQSILPPYEARRWAVCEQIPRCSCGDSWVSTSRRAASPTALGRGTRRSRILRRSRMSNAGFRTTDRDYRDKA
jgi:hypothetical protein